MSDEQRHRAIPCSNRYRITLSIVLNVAAFASLIPGLVCPLLTVQVLIGDMVLFSQTRGILSTVSYLYREEALIPATLILLFSVFVPVLKFMLLILMASSRDVQWKWRLHRIVRDWSKWSMADVFVTAVFVAFLSANASPSSMHASLGIGFYFFLAYCLLSLLALQLLPPPVDIETQEATDVLAHSTTRQADMVKLIESPVHPMSSNRALDDDNSHQRVHAHAVDLEAHHPESSSLLDRE